MATTVKTAISIQKSLFEQAESLAQELNVSRSELFGLAIESFVKNRQNQMLLQEIKHHIEKTRKYIDLPSQQMHLDLVQQQSLRRWTNCPGSDRDTAIADGLHPRPDAATFPRESQRFPGWKSVQLRSVTTLVFLGRCKAWWKSPPRLPLIDHPTL